MFVQVHTHRTPTHTSFQAPSSLRPSRVSFRRLSDALRAEPCLSEASSIVRPPKRGLPRPNIHSHVWPHRRCCHACHSQQLRLHIPQGNMNSCSCCSCEGLLESRYHPESRALGGFCPPCSRQEPRRDMVLGMVHKA